MYSLLENCCRNLTEKSTKSRSETKCERFSLQVLYQCSVCHWSKTPPIWQVTQTRSHLPQLCYKYFLLQSLLFLRPPSVPGQLCNPPAQTLFQRVSSSLCETEIPVSADFIPTTGPGAWNSSLALTELHLGSAQGQSNYWTFTPTVTSRFSLFSALLCTKLYFPDPPPTLLPSPSPPCTVSPSDTLTPIFTCAFWFSLLFFPFSNFVTFLAFPSSFHNAFLLDTCCLHKLLLFFFLFLCFFPHFFLVLCYMLWIIDFVELALKL